MNNANKGQHKPGYAGLWAIACALSITTACAEDLSFADDSDDEQGSQSDGDTGGSDLDTGVDTGTGDDSGGEGKIETEDLGGGLWSTQVDSSIEGEWIYLDLDTGTETEIGWDLGFMRFGVKLNGGESGDGGVEVAILEGVEIADIKTAADLPDSLMWLTDAPDADEDGDLELAFGDWYDYDFSTHVLTPKPRVYVVRSDEDALFALQIDDYYSSAGTGGHFMFRWRAL